MNNLPKIVTQNAALFDYESNQRPINRKSIDLPLPTKSAVIQYLSWTCCVFWLHMLTISVLPP